MLAHGRSDSPLLKEIAPDESAYRSLTMSWFQHSSLFGMLKLLSDQKKVKIILTTDHGSVRCMRGSKIIGDKEASANLRYKFGRNLKVDEKHAIFIKNPLDFKLTRGSVTSNCVIAKEIITLSIRQIIINISASTTTVFSMAVYLWKK